MQSKSFSTMKMQAIILAGGLGTRLQATVRNVPKALAPVAGKPFIDHLLEELARQGFSLIVLAVGHLREQIIARIGNRYSGLDIRYSLETTPLGTGGTIRRALNVAASAPVLWSIVMPG